MIENIRVAVIGSTGRGDYGHSLDTVWLDVPGAQIVGVADDNEAGLSAAASRLKTERTFSDYRKMLDEVKPEFVSIGPRWIHRHHEMALACAERGIHMYLEKPFCQTLAQADEVAAACERTHARLALACQTHYSPKVATAKRLIADGAIGRVLEFRARGKEDGRGGGEDLWVLGTHMLDLIRHFGGDPHWCFASLTQSGKPVLKSDVRGGNEGLGPLAGDAVRAVYGMPDEATGYFASVRGAGKGDARFALQIFGTAGMMEVMFGYMTHVRYLPDPAWSPSRSGKKWLNVSSAGIDRPETISKGGIPEGNRVAVLDLIASVREHRAPLCGLTEARGTLEMIHAVFESHRVGTRAEMPLKNRQHPLTMLR